MLRRIWALTIKEFIHLRNDWWLPVFMLLAADMPGFTPLKAGLAVGIYGLTQALLQQHQPRLQVVADVGQADGGIEA